MCVCFETSLVLVLTLDVCCEVSLVLVMTMVVKYSYLFQGMTLAVYLRVLIIVAILCTGHGVIFCGRGDVCGLFLLFLIHVGIALQFRFILVPVMIMENTTCVLTSFSYGVGCAVLILSHLSVN